MNSVMISDDAEKLHKSQEFKQMCADVNKGKDDWEKAMNIKKLASKNKGDGLVNLHMKIYDANRTREKKEAGENEIVRRDSDLNRGEFRLDGKAPKLPKAGK